MPVSPEFIEALRRLDPAQTPTDGQWIDRPEEVMGRGWDLAERLELLIEAKVPIRALLHGAVGVGKTTEMQRLTKKINCHIENFSGDTPLDLIEMIYNLKKTEYKQYNLIIVDGLDLLPNKEITEELRQGTMLCNEELPNIMYIIPHDTALETTRDTRDHRFTDIYHLAPFPIQGIKGTQQNNAIEYMANGLMKRFEDIPINIDSNLLKRVAYYSGGIPRHAIIILRHAILASAKKNIFLPTHILHGERELRQDLEQALRNDDISTLIQVHQTGKFISKKESDRLIRNSVIIPYDGPENRYWSVHPLLLSRILQ